MNARIYQPARTAMSSGQAKTKGWVLEFAQDSARSVDPLMGWTSSNDTRIDAVVSEPNKRKPVIRQNGYAENFATNRRTVWTH